MQSNKKEQFMKSGLYHLSKDEKTLFLGHDPANIVTLNTEQLIVKTTQMVLYFDRFNH